MTMEEAAYMDLDAKHLREQKYSFDMGGTLTKLVYIETNSKTDHTGTLRLRFKVFSSKEPWKMVHFINKVYPPNTSKPATTLNCTGICTLKHKQMLEERLHVKLQVINELDQFANALAVLVQNCKAHDVFKAPDLAAEGRAMKNVMDWAEVLQQLTFKNDTPTDATTEKTGDDKVNAQDSETKTKSDENQNSEKEPQSENQSESSEPPKTYLPVNRNMYNEETKTVLPCLHVMLGSATGYMRVDGNGKSSIVNGGPIGGKYFLALARLATGVTDFEEMVSLAEKGTIKNVDLFGVDAKDELKGTDESGLYTAFPDDQTLYGLGKLSISDEKFRKEDLLASLFHYLICETTNLVKNVARQYDLKRVYFTGGFLQNEFVKGLAEEYMGMLLTAFQIDPEIKYGFIQHGNMYGALGCLLKSD